MLKIIPLATSLFLFFSFIAFSQTENPVYYNGATREKRNSLYRNIVQNTITKNLSFPLNADTEDKWTNAFWGMELLQYKSPWTDGRIHLAFDSIEKRSTGFQRALLELGYTSYTESFIKQVTSLLNHTRDAKVFAMSAEYLLVNNRNFFAGINLEDKKNRLIRNEKDEAITSQLFYNIQHPPHQKNCNPVEGLLSRDFLKHHTILYSFQRRNRNYPGLAMVRDTLGNFITDETGAVFSVPQLARSINNLPGYLTNGNTPQGIFRMYGFDTSKTTFIGPTTNIQLTMPFETSLQHFFNDSTITDSLWTEEWYKKLLPPDINNCRPVYGSFYAGKAGRTEIIAHGTTVDPAYYAGEIYYPQTPTMGCLCTKETWSDVDGKRLESDQQKLTNAVQKAGGANGYCVVIEIDDMQKPVTIHEILSLLKPGTSK
ncbi:MAG: hypothetical protein H7Z13_12390 [Ferruginibacter sp.]|nr:hypothetical protein [Ferruginibacter sp.]